MIEVNIWFSTTEILGKRIKNAVGSFFSGPLNKNAGHVNFRMDVIEGTAAFQKMQANNGQWIYEKTFTRVGEIAKGKSAEVNPDGEGHPARVNTHKQRTIKLEYRHVKKVRANLVHHSFWPGPTPSVGSIFKDIFHLIGLSEPSKGVAAELSTHEMDMDEKSQLKKLQLLNIKGLLLILIQLQKNKNVLRGFLKEPYF